MSIRYEEELTREMSAFESLYGGQITLPINSVSKTEYSFQLGLTDAAQEFFYIICLLTFVSEKHKTYLIFIKQLYHSCSQRQNKSILGLVNIFTLNFELNTGTSKG